MMDLPPLAISVRQPWAWAIIHAGKDIENRAPYALRFMEPLRGRRAIHAAKGMTRDEYFDAREFMDSIGVQCPAPADLQRGGIIGSVTVVDVVRQSDSPWFVGPRGMVLRDPRPCDFIPAIGALGYFAWKRGDASIVPPPAQWMLPQVDKSSATSPDQSETSQQRDLFAC